MSVRAGLGGMKCMGGVARRFDKAVRFAFNHNVIIIL